MKNAEKNLSNKANIIWPIVVVIVAGLAFYGGTMYNAGKSKSAFPGGANFAGARGGNAAGANRNRAGMIAGAIAKVDGNNLTVTTPDGGSKLILLSGNTVISQMATSSVSDLTVGKSVVVSGGTSQDGIVTAQTIQVRPAGWVQPTNGRMDQGTTTPDGRPTTPNQNQPRQRGAGVTQ